MSLRPIAVAAYTAIALGSVPLGGCGSSGGAESLFAGSGIGGAPCATDANCSGSTPRCNAATGACVGCLGAADCREAGTVCDAMAQRCLTTCVTTADCSMNGVNGTCDATRGNVCVECRTDAECTSDSRRLCDTAAARCVQCRSNVDCGAGEPFCRGGECTQCRSDADCAAGRRCNADFECALPCGATLCGGNTPVCDPTSSSCLECLTDRDCTSGGSPHCATASNRCVECVDNTQCDASKVCSAAGKCD